MNTRWLLPGALALGLIGVGLPRAAELMAADPLKVPASASPLAAHTQLIGVTQAGTRWVAVGWRGHIVYSDDKGQTWQQAQVPVSTDLTAVHFPTPQDGWAVGHSGTVLHSNDAGATWQLQQNGVATGALMRAHYESRLDSDPSAATQLDNVKLNYDNGPDQPWLGVWFENALHGYVVGAFNLIMETLDGGKSWTPLMERVDNPDSLHLGAIEQVGGQLYIASERGVVFRLDPVSGRFKALATGYTGTFFGVTGNGHVLLAYGLAGNAYRSLDQGLSWEHVSTGTGITLTAGTPLPDGRLVLSTQGGPLLLSDTDAHTFTPLHPPAPSLLAGLAAVGPDRVLAVGTAGAQLVRVTHPLAVAPQPVDAPRAHKEAP